MNDTTHRGQRVAATGMTDYKGRPLWSVEGGPGAKPAGVRPLLISQDEARRYVNERLGLLEWRERRADAVRASVRDAREALDSLRCVLTARVASPEVHHQASALLDRCDYYLASVVDVAVATAAVRLGDLLNVEDDGARAERVRAIHALTAPEGGGPDQVRVRLAAILISALAPAGAAVYCRAGFSEAGAAALREYGLVPVPAPK